MVHLYHRVHSKKYWQKVNFWTRYLENQKSYRQNYFTIRFYSSNYIEKPSFNSISPKVGFWPRTLAHIGYFYNPVLPGLPQEFFFIFLNLDLLAIFLAKNIFVVIPVTMWKNWSKIVELQTSFLQYFLFILSCIL